MIHRLSSVVVILLLSASLAPTFRFFANQRQYQFLAQASVLRKTKSLPI